jgi:magnesium chelatase subunit I
MSRPEHLGELRAAVAAGTVPHRSVKLEMRQNLMDLLRRNETLLPGIVGYEDSVIPQIANAVLSQHNFVLLGLRGQAKTRILRGLTSLLDEWLPVVPGCQINDDPLDPLCRSCRTRIAEEGDALPVAWLPRDRRFIEKLATPDVTIADIIGDVDPIKAARAGLELSDELTMHYGLLPRANRCLFAVNELPDLAGKIQVGLFNVLQEGDVQIKGYPIRLPLDIVMTFTANPEDYTARGKIITPLKDRIGSEIRTHYPRTRVAGIEITAQESWVARDDDHAGADTVSTVVPRYISELVEEVAFVARDHAKVDKRSGVSQRLPISCLENVVSNAERRALAQGESVAVARVADLYSALPAITGKFFDGWFTDVDTSAVVEWFDLGGTLQVGDTTSAADLLEQTAKIQGLRELTVHAKVDASASAPAVASGVEFIIEGLYARKKISRSDDWQYHATPRRSRKSPTAEQLFDADMRIPEGKKKYYN